MFEGPPGKKGMDLFVIIVNMIPEFKTPRVKVIESWIVSLFQEDDFNKNGTFTAHSDGLSIT